MVTENGELNKGIRKDNIEKPGNPTPTFSLDTEEERDNFIEYLKTDFARFCLSFYKNNANLGTGELAIIPWLDFTNKWTDKELYEKFNVSEELQNYINTFIPDYHGIRC
jgi:site-specific DNA-methyltransferase (adenine-specific)